jgi:hypothetical protein
MFVAIYRGVKMYRNGRWYSSDVSPLEWSSPNQVMNEIDQTLGKADSRPQIHYTITQGLEFKMN